MPNWCENDLRILGNHKEITKVLEGIKKINPIEQVSNPNCPEDILQLVAEAHKKGTLKEIAEELLIDFNTAAKYPEGLVYSNIANKDDGYHWCVDNWGTKWNASDPCIKRIGKNSVFLQFETAWSPPKPVIIAWSQKFPKVKFSLRYYEQGMAYKGYLVVKAGDILIDESSKYSGNRGG